MSKKAETSLPLRKFAKICIDECCPALTAMRQQDVSFEKHAVPTITTLEYFILILHQEKPSTILFELVQEILNLMHDIVVLFDKEEDLLPLRRKIFFHRSINYLHSSKMSEHFLYVILKHISSQKTSVELIEQELDFLRVIAEECMFNFKLAEETKQPEIMTYVYRFSEKMLNDFKLWWSTYSKNAPLNQKHYFYYITLKNIISTINFLMNQAQLERAGNLINLADNLLSSMKYFLPLDKNSSEIMQMITHLIQCNPDFYKKTSPTLSFLLKLIKVLSCEKEKSPLILGALISWEKVKASLEEKEPSKKAVIKEVAVQTPKPSTTPKTAVTYTKKNTRGSAYCKREKTRKIKRIT